MPIRRGSSNGAVLSHRRDDDPVSQLQPAHLERRKKVAITHEISGGFLNIGDVRLRGEMLLIIAVGELQACLLDCAVLNLVERYVITVIILRDGVVAFGIVAT